MEEFCKDLPIHEGNSNAIGGCAEVDKDWHPWMTDPIDVNTILKEQDVPLLWNYTQSMLRGFGVLPFDRIHTLLKMYATSDIKSEQVKSLLDLKVKEGLLKYNGGVYRLNK